MRGLVNGTLSVSDEAGLVSTPGEFPHVHLASAWRSLKPPFAVNHRRSPEGGSPYNKVLWTNRNLNEAKALTNIMFYCIRDRRLYDLASSAAYVLHFFAYHREFIWFRQWRNYYLSVWVSNSNVQHTLEALDFLVCSLMTDSKVLLFHSHESTAEREPILD